MLTEAIHYVTEIRKRFPNEPEIYRSFLDMLREYLNKEKDIQWVLERMTQLFPNHPDLLMDFVKFLPEIAI